MKPLPSRPDPSLTERTPQEREDGAVSLADFQRIAHVVEQVGEALDPILGGDLYVKARPYADGFAELTVTALVGPGPPPRPQPRPLVHVRGIFCDPSPFPRFRLFRWLP